MKIGDRVLMQFEYDGISRSLGSYEISNLILVESEHKVAVEFRGITRAFLFELSEFERLFVLVK